MGKRKSIAMKRKNPPQKKIKQELREDSGSINDTSDQQASRFLSTPPLQATSEGNLAMGKKRRQPKRREELEEAEGDSANIITSDQQTSERPSPHEGFFSAPLVSRYPVRRGKMPLGHCAGFATPLRRSSRNVKGIPYEYSTLGPTTNALAETIEQSSPAANTNIQTSEKSASELPPAAQVSNSQVASSHNQHAKSTPSQIVIPELAMRGETTGDSESARSKSLSIPTTNEFLELEKLAADFIAQTLEPEDLHLDTPSAAQVSNSQGASCPYQHAKRTLNQPGTSKLAASETIGNLIETQSVGSGALSIPTANEFVELEHQSIAEDLTPGDLHIDAPPTGHDIVSGDHLLTKEANLTPDTTRNRLQGAANNFNEADGHLSRTSSFNLTQIAARLIDDSADPEEVDSAFNVALVTVQGYRVREDVAPLVRSILSRYGDIARDTTVQSITFRSYILEMACRVYQQLEQTDSKRITNMELQSMLDVVGDLETVKLEVGWLHQRLDEISEALQLSKGYSSLKEENSRSIRDRERKKKELEGLLEKVILAKAELAVMESRAEKIKETILDTRAKMKSFFQRSLVDGIL